jgi:hypothetical protein
MAIQAMHATISEDPLLAITAAMTTRPATNLEVVRIRVLLDPTVAKGVTLVTGLQIVIRVITHAMNIMPVLTHMVSQFHDVCTQYFSVPNDSLHVF